MTPFYDRDGITIYCGDCLEIMPQLEGPFDAIICDLPYGSIDAEWDSILPLDRLWRNYKELISLTGAIISFGQDPFSSVFVVSNLEMYRHKLVWIKDKSPNFLAASYMPLKCTEDVLIFSPAGYTHNANPRATYNPQMTPGEWKPPSSNRLGKSIAQIRKRPMTSHKAILNPQSKHNGLLRYPKNYIYCPVPYNSERKHPTQKPLALLRYLIRTYTNPSDLILDNTMGSGTTLVAAQIEGRRAVGIDISEEYCQIAVDRLKPPGFLSSLRPNSNSNGTVKGEQLKLI